MATSAAATALFGASAGAQTASSSAPELQEIVVTGSLIKRTDTETPSPVQIITAEDLKNSGYTNVSDVLRTLSANGSGLSIRASVKRLPPAHPASHCAVCRWVTR